MALCAELSGRCFAGWEGVSVYAAACTAIFHRWVWRKWQKRRLIAGWPSELGTCVRVAAPNDCRRLSFDAGGFFYFGVLWGIPQIVPQDDFQDVSVCFRWSSKKPYFADLI